MTNYSITEYRWVPIQNYYIYDGYNIEHSKSTRILIALKESAIRRITALTNKNGAAVAGEGLAKEASYQFS